MEQELSDELELLRSMYSDSELSIDENAKAGAATVSLSFSFGHTDGAASEEAAAPVRATLRLSARKGYPATPDAPLAVDFPSYRGLSDSDVRRVLVELRELAHDAADNGQQVMFQVIEAARERLSDLASRVECGICLESVTIDPSARTSAAEAPVVNRACGHGFHADCMRRWVRQLLQDWKDTPEQQLRRTSARQAIAAAEGQLSGAQRAQADLQKEELLLGQYLHEAEGDVKQLRKQLEAADPAFAAAQKEAAAAAAAETSTGSTASVSSGGGGGGAKKGGKGSSMAPPPSPAASVSSSGSAVRLSAAELSELRNSLVEASRAVEELSRRLKLVGQRLLGSEQEIRRAQGAVEAAMRVYGTAAAGDAALLLSSMPIPCPLCRAVIPWDSNSSNTAAGSNSGSSSSSSGFLKPKLLALAKAQASNKKRGGGEAPAAEDESTALQRLLVTAADSSNESDGVGARSGRSSSPSSSSSAPPSSAPALDPACHAYVSAYWSASRAAYDRQAKQGGLIWDSGGGGGGGGGGAAGSSSPSPPDDGKDAASPGGGAVSPGASQAAPSPSLTAGAPLNSKTASSSSTTAAVGSGKSAPVASSAVPAAAAAAAAGKNGGSASGKPANEASASLRSSAHASSACSEGPRASSSSGQSKGKAQDTQRPVASSSAPRAAPTGTAAKPAASGSGGVSSRPKATAKDPGGFWE